MVATVTIVGAIADASVNTYIITTGQRCAGDQYRRQLRKPDQQFHSENLLVFLFEWPGLQRNTGA